VLGLIIQNGSAHEEGHDEAWDSVRAYWANPTPETRAALPDWLNFEGTRDQYTGGPDRIRPLFAPEKWHFDWERLSRPGMIDIQFGIFRDYANHVARLSEFSAYHEKHQPPALILWGRHDTYFAVDEVLAYSRELERLEAHIFDGFHFLLETHHAECAALMREFIRNVMAGEGARRSS
jgi:pimeloyl-ACP methyl ester carboxylesterase